jgi:DNA polymerase alpha subunit A
MCKYIDQSAVCDDAACRMKTRSCSVFGRRCLVTGCKGFVNLEYSDAKLYTQMQYYEQLFALDSYLAKIEPQEDGMHIIKKNAQTMDELAAVVERYLNTSSRRWVDLAQIFSFAV